MNHKAYVAESEGKGRGVFSYSNLDAGELALPFAELLVLSMEDTFKVQYTALKNYTYLFDENRDCLALGLASLLNHSDSPNVSYELDFTAGRPRLRFTALRPIAFREELTIDYNKDYEVDIEEVKAAKSLVVVA